MLVRHGGVLVTSQVSETERLYHRSVQDLEMCHDFVFESYSCVIAGDYLFDSGSNRDNMSQHAHVTVVVIDRGRYRDPTCIIPLSDKTREVAQVCFADNQRS
jgi:hypothetical protein